MTEKTKKTFTLREAAVDQMDPVWVNPLTSLQGNVENDSRHMLRKQSLDYPTDSSMRCVL